MNRNVNCALVSFNCTLMVTVLIKRKTQKYDAIKNDKIIVLCGNYLFLVHCLNVLRSDCIFTLTMKLQRVSGKILLLLNDKF